MQYCSLMASQTYDDETWLKKLQRNDEIDLEPNSSVESLADRTFHELVMEGGSRPGEEAKVEEAGVVTCGQCWQLFSKRGAKSKFPPGEFGTGVGPPVRLGSWVWQSEMYIFTWVLKRYVELNFWTKALTSSSLTEQRQLWDRHISNLSWMAITESQRLLSALSSWQPPSPCSSPCPVSNACFLGGGGPSHAIPTPSFSSLFTKLFARRRFASLPHLEFRSFLAIFSCSVYYEFLEHLVTLCKALDFECALLEIGHIWSKDNSEFVSKTLQTRKGAILFILSSSFDLCGKLPLRLSA